MPVHRESGFKNIFHINISRRGLTMSSHSFAYSPITNPEYSVLLSVLSPPGDIVKVERIIGPADASFDSSPIDGRSAVYKLAALVPAFSPSRTVDTVELEQWISHAFSEQCDSFLTNHTEDEGVLGLLHSRLRDRTYLLGTNTPSVVDAIWYARISPRVFNFPNAQGNDYYRVVRWAKHLADLWGVGMVELAKLVGRLQQGGTAQSLPLTESKKEKKKSELVTKVEHLSLGDPFEAIDLRVGLITSVEKHPTADRLYIEQVDFAEGRLRTVVSGLVEHVSREALQGRLAVFVCNLKPAMLCKVLSEGMLLVGKDETALEPLNVPEGSKLGDRITVQGVNTPSAYPTLKPKDTNWEAVKPKLVVKGSQAMYDQRPLLVNGKPVTVTSIFDGVIS